MPNWSYNSIAIYGKKNLVEKIFDNKYFTFKNAASLRDYLSNTEITMRSWMPMPQTFLDYDTANHIRPLESMFNANGEPMTEKEYEDYVKGFAKAVAYQKATYDIVGWYDYNCATLGTKWDAELSLETFEETDDIIGIIFNFETAWDAPMPWFETFCKEFCKGVEVEMECHEESQAFDFSVLWNGEKFEPEVSLDSPFNYNEDEEVEETN